MKNSLFRSLIATFAFSLTSVAFAQFTYDISTADVVITSPNSDADWNKTYNQGSPSAVTFKPTEATVSERNTCNNKENGKQNTLTLSSSDSHWLDISVPATSTAEITHVMFRAVGNSSGSWTENVWSSTSSSFDASAAYKTEFTLNGYQAPCSYTQIELPAGIKSIRLYRRVKTSDNGDGTYSLACDGCKTNTGSGQTYALFEFYVWLKKGPQITKYVYLGRNGVISEVDATTSLITVNVPYSADLTQAYVPNEVVISDGASFIGANNASSAVQVVELGAGPTVQYQLTDGENNRTYNVIAKREAAKTGNAIRTFSYIVDGDTIHLEKAQIDTLDNSQDGTPGNLYVTLPYSYQMGRANETKARHIKAWYTMAELASASPVVADSIYDFLSNPKITVTSESGEPLEYTVNVSFEAPQTGKDITSFRFTELGDAQAIEINDIDDANGTIRVAVGATANLSSLTPEITLSDRATISPAAVTSNFSTEKTYTVTAENGSTKTYTVSVFRDSEGPQVHIYSPLNGATGVSISGYVLDSIFDDASVSIGTADQIRLVGGGQTFNLNPDILNPDKTSRVPYSGLALNTEYTLTFDWGVYLDQFGNGSSPVEIKFTTGDGKLHNEDLPYASHMNGASFDQPTFISGATYNPDVSTYSSTSTEFGAYVIPAGGTLSINTDATTNIGSILVYYFSPSTDGAIQIATTNGASIDNTLEQYRLRHLSQAVELPVNAAGQTITVSNPGTSDIYIPYIYISANGQPALTEKDVWCTE
ncbi:MAG: DUF5018 domain-containing protein [Paludibacteraceae bacterium]|nr:DUF5018 domain-containing protein [Paludibacteraceae bacterium]